MQSVEENELATLNPRSAPFSASEFVSSEWKLEACDVHFAAYMKMTII